MKNEKLLTVIVLTYNSEKYIKDALHSILNQTYNRIELIVADDGSLNFNANDLHDFIEKYKKNNLVSYTVYTNSQNIGTVKNLNKAIKKAKGEFISAIAGDDLYYNDLALASLVKSLEENEEHFIAVGKILSCSDDLEIFYNTRINLSNKKISALINRNSEEIISYVFKRNIIMLATQACCFRSEFFSRYGLYDESYVLLEDLPMMLRIIKNNIRFGYVDAFIVLHREGTGISSTKDVLSIKSYRYYLDMLNFFEKEVSKYKIIVGKILVMNRVKLYKFRVKYTKLLIENNNWTYKLFLILRYSITLVYYVVGKNVRDIINKIILRSKI